MSRLNLLCNIGVFIIFVILLVITVVLNRSIIPNRIERKIKKIIVLKLKKTGFKYNHRESNRFNFIFTNKDKNQRIGFSRLPKYSYIQIYFQRDKDYLLGYEIDENINYYIDYRNKNNLNNAISLLGDIIYNNGLTYLENMTDTYKLPSNEDHSKLLNNPRRSAKKFIKKYEISTSEDICETILQLEDILKKLKGNIEDNKDTLINLAAFFGQIIKKYHEAEWMWDEGCILRVYGYINMDMYPLKIIYNYFQSPEIEPYELLNQYKRYVLKVVKPSYEESLPKILNKIVNISDLNTAYSYYISLEDIPYNMPTKKMHKILYNNRTKEVENFIKMFNLSYMDDRIVLLENIQNILRNLNGTIDDNEEILLGASAFLGELIVSIYNGSWIWDEISGIAEVRVKNNDNEVSIAPLSSIMLYYLRPNNEEFTLVKENVSIFNG